MDKSETHTSSQLSFKIKKGNLDSVYENTNPMLSSGKSLVESKKEMQAPNLGMTFKKNKLNNLLAGTLTSSSMAKLDYTVSSSSVAKLDQTPVFHSTPKNMTMKSKLIHTNES